MVTKKNSKLTVAKEGRRKASRGTIGSTVYYWTVFPLRAAVFFNKSWMYFSTRVRCIFQQELDVFVNKSPMYF